MAGPEVAKAYVTIIPSLQGAQQTITQELTGASSLAGNAAGKTTGASMAASIGKSFGAAGKTLTKYVSVPLAGIGTAAFKSAADFETAFAQLTTIADTSTVSVGDLKSGVMDLSSELGISSSEISTAAYSAISAGQDTADALGFVESAAKLARGGFTDVSTATDVLTTALNAYGLEADQVSHVSDVLIQTQNEGKTTVDELAASMGRVIPTAANVNVGLEDLASQYVALTKNGIGTAEATTYINSMLNELGKSGTTAFDMFSEAAGMTFPEYIAAGHSTTEAMEVLSGACEDAGLKVSDAFGSAEAGKAANVLVQHAEDSTTALGNMMTMAGQTETAYSTMSDTTAVKLEEMKTKLQNLAITIGDQIIPMLEPIVDSVVSWIETISEKWSSLDSGTQQTILTIAAIVVAVGPLLSVISTVIATITTLSTAVSALGTVFTLLSGPVGIVIAVIAALIAIGVLLYQNWDTIKAKATEIWTSITNFFSRTWESIKNGVTTAWNAIKNTITNVWNGIKTGITTAVTAVSSTISRGWNTIKTGASTAWNAVKTTVSSAWSGITSKVSSAASSVRSTLSSAWSNIQSRTSSAWSSIQSSIASHGGGIRGVIGAAVQGYQSLWSSAFSAINSITGGRLQAAYQTVSNVLSNIKSAFSSKLEAARSAVSNVISGIRGLFNFSWSLPHLALPHFSFSGSFSLNPPSVPHLSVSWYKRAAEEGALFSTPQIIGVGDAAQPELLIGEDRLKELVSGGEQNIPINVYGAVGQDVNALAEIIEQKLAANINRRRAVFA